MGIFAAAGGGKSTLLSSILKGCTADVCVLALIGERGREVREFIERDIGPEGRKKAVLVVSTSDRSSMERPIRPRPFPNISAIRARACC